ncbi:MAG: LD-carboxypeptidase [Candidatus Sumerlaeaceae bacterium]|nr:LD-carboxypeptidase [Candidatus Sumerlaeaceae bacterium]
MLLKPRRLKPGMTVGVIAPASGVKDETQVDAAVAGLEEFGLRVRLGRSVRKRRGFVSATPAERLADLHAAFADKTVDAVMCLRGGYGTMHLLDAIDYDLVRRNPKIFTGFSDITALHLAFLRKCRLVTFNGPMASTTFSKHPPSAFSVASFLRTVSEPVPAGSVWQGHADRKFRIVRPGRAEGPLTGGNLTLVAATVGTPYEIETRGRIVFLEEVDEKPYRVDRYLTQLLLAGKLRDAAAVVFGRNVADSESAENERRRLGDRPPRRAMPPPRRVPRDFEQIIDEVIAERLAPLGIPVMIGLPFGHIEDYATLPMGCRASVDAARGDLVVEEAAVR